MKLKSFLECERRSAQKLLNFQLPNAFKKLGWLVFIISFITIITVKIFADDHNSALLIKSIGKYSILVGIFLVSLSREKVEDEFIRSLRMQSYMFAFLVSILYAIIYPFITLGADAIANESATLNGIGDFFILWMLLCLQVFYFHLLRAASND